MNIAVIAANGRSGQAFVTAVLAAGHHVRAGVRSGDLPFGHQNLTITVCDATNEKDVKHLVQGQDIVVSLIGHVKGSPSDVQTKAIRTLIAATKHGSVKRIISLTGTGVRFDGDVIPFYDRFLNFGVRTIDPDRIQDGIDHVEVLRASKADWTVIRVLKLQELGRQKFELRENGPTLLYVSRQDVAAAILDIIKRDTFHHKAPIISY